MNAVILAVVAWMVAPALAAEPPATISVQETANVEAVHDIARVEYTIVNEAPLTKSVTDLVNEHNLRVKPTQQYLESVCGKGGVCVTPRVEKVQKRKHNPQTGEDEYEVVGNRIITTIEAKLEGEKNIDQKLGQLFESSKMKVDTIGSPVTTFSDTRLSETKVSGLKQNRERAVASATALLEPGEKLGKIRQRADQSSLHASVYGEGTGMRVLSDSGRIVVQTGKGTVRVVSQFVFEVNGQPDRLKQNQGSGK